MKGAPPKGTLRHPPTTYCSPPDTLRPSSMLRVDRSTLFLIVAALLVLGGCRTYGGYDTKPKTYQALEKSVESFADELNRSETEGRTLADAATASDTLQALADEYQALLSEHETLLETQRGRIERLSPSSGYRTLHHAYGATVTEQRMMEQKYERLTRTVQATVRGTQAAAETVKVERRYTIRPIGFPSVRDEGALTMERALRGLDLSRP